MSKDADVSGALGNNAEGATDLHGQRGGTVGSRQPVPGAHVVQGLDDEEESTDTTRDVEQGTMMHGTNDSMSPVSARVVDTEAELRVVQEQNRVLLENVRLREERERLQAMVTKRRYQWLAIGATMLILVGVAISLSVTLRQSRDGPPSPIPPTPTTPPTTTAPIPTEEPNSLLNCSTNERPTAGSYWFFENDESYEHDKDDAIHMDLGDKGGILNFEPASDGPLDSSDTWLLFADSIGDPAELESWSSVVRLEFEGSLTEFGPGNLPVS